MGSEAVIYIPSFIKIGSGIQKLMGGGICRHTHRQQGDLISLLLYFQNKESRLKMKCKFKNCIYIKHNLISGSGVLFIIYTVVTGRLSDNLQQIIQLIQWSSYAPHVNPLGTGTDVQHNRQARRPTNHKKNHPDYSSCKEFFPNNI
jgi:hypothetical protein